MKWNRNATAIFIRNLIGYLILMGYAFYSNISIIHSSSFIRYFEKVGIYYTIIYVWCIIHNRILFEKIFLRKRKPLYFLLMTIITVAWLIMEYYYWDHSSKGSLLSEGFLIYSPHLAVLFFVYTLVGLSFYIVLRYSKEREKFYKAILSSKEMEMNALKTHLNPHFLFNALNNIYSYALHHDHYANELILKVSQLMRFIIDSSGKDKIMLSEEIGFIENYLVFEKERLGERCTINYSKKIADPGKPVIPLILFPFIENAFKHGSNTIQTTTIEILIDDAPGKLNLVVKNNIVNKNPVSTRTGLFNARRRLELLYPGRHKIAVLTDEHNLFIVDLTLLYEEN